MPSSSIRVIVADDHAPFRSGIVTLLSTTPDITVVGVAEDGPAAVELAERVRPDVVLTDVRMPGETGIDITPRLCAIGCRVLVISAFGLDEYVLGSIAAGADGYLVKTERPANIIAAVRSVSLGDSALSNETTSAVVAALRQRPETPPQSDVALTKREEEVLELIAVGHSNRDIASELFIGETTVKTHLGNLFGKLGVTSRVQAALWHSQNRAR